MALFRKFIAIVLISLFAMSAISEIAANDNHALSDSAVNLAPEFSVSVRSAPFSGATDVCCDPCHSGICHFGHCSHLVIQNQNLVFLTHSDLEWTPALSARLASPDLDSWRRPPRSMFS